MSKSQLGPSNLEFTLDINTSYPRILEYKGYRIDYKYPTRI